MSVAVEVLWFAAGIAVLFLVVDSALRTFVLPRGVLPPLTRVVTLLRGVFQAVARARRTYDGRDAVMALYAPIFLVALPLTWLVLVILAFTAMFHAMGVSGFERAFEMSGSSLLTLGFVRPPDVETTALAFVEATVGLALLALLIAYLPTIYSAFSRREALVAQLAARGPEPPSGVSILVRAQEMERFELLADLWVPWQAWFAELEETHTSLGVVNFFRSPRPHRSWVTSCGAVLDAASLRLSAVALPFDPQAGLCVRSGFVALDAVAAYFHLPYDERPLPTDPISISREEFDEACGQLAAAGIALRADRDQAWRDFNGWRVNYDRALLGLAGLLMVPYAPWSSDRSYRIRRITRRPIGSAEVRTATPPAGWDPRRGG